MNFSFNFKKTDKKDQRDKDASNLLKDAVECYKKAIQESAAQYNEHRKKAEEEINRGARLTKHRINL